MSVLRPQPIAEQEKEAVPGASGLFKTLWPMSASKDWNLVRRRWRFGKANIEGEVSVEQAGELIRALPTGVYFLDEFRPVRLSGTTVLKNIPGIRNQEILDRFEADRVAQRL